jgi:hypothetical protein
MGKLVDSPVVHTMADSDYIYGAFGNVTSKMSIDEFRQHLNDNDEEVLNDLAFYIDINVASGNGSTRVNVGGNMHMRALWEDAAVSVLMDANGNYCELNKNDNRYTKEGSYILNGDGTLISAFANADVMKIRPMDYGKIQTKTIGATTVLRQWLSLVPLPGGYARQARVVGKFKCRVVDGKLRSIPGVVPSNNVTIKSFWDYAQVRSKNHGLANLEFRNDLLYHMMAKYGWRDSQNCKTTDNSLVWGVGLDGSENTTGSAASGFDRQKNIKTGATLSLGESDGNVAVTDSEGGTCHSVSVAGFENPWGQYWEMVQGLCSVGTDVYCWKHNFMPAGSAPTADTFAGVEHVMLTRATSEGAGQTNMNIIASQDGQGSYMIPSGSLSGVSYGDYYYYAAAGQLWLFGGSSDNGSKCGLAGANSDNAWTYASSNRSARLAFYGDVNKVSEARLRELLS